MKPSPLVRQQAQPDEPVPVAYFRDADDTWFAAEVIHASAWDESLLEPLDHEEADIRIAFIDDALVHDMPKPPHHPDWLCLLSATDEEDPVLVTESARSTWESLLGRRMAGPPPEAYLLAGFQALCPPHPACSAGPGLRDSLMEFLEGRAGPLGRLTRHSADGVNRLLRIYWETPEAFAEEILEERIRDDGGRGVLQLVQFLREAEVAEEVDAYAHLEVERRALLARLPALAYFMRPSDFDRAAAIGLDWRERYQRAYQVHYRAVLQAAREAVIEAEPASRLLSELAALNSQGRPIGRDAARRLQGALEDLATLPEGVDERAPRTAGIILGRTPSAIAEARLSAAAVMAAVDVQRRRQAGVSLA